MRRALWVCLGWLALWTTGCGAAAPLGHDAGPMARVVTRADSCIQLRDRLATSLADRWAESKRPRIDADLPPPMESAPVGASPAAPAAAMGVPSAGDERGTLGTVQFDGELAYAAWNDQIAIVRVSPAREAGLVATVRVDGLIDGMLLHGDRLVAISSGVGARRSAPPFMPRESTRLTQIDVTDPDAPRLEREIDLDGVLIGARVVDGVLWGATSHRLHLGVDPSALFASVSDWPEWDGREDEAVLDELTERRAAILREHILAAVPVDEVALRLGLLRSAAPGEVDAPIGAVVGCEDVLVEHEAVPTTLTVISGIDLTRRDGAHATVGLLASDGAASDRRLTADADGIALSWSEPHGDEPGDTAVVVHRLLATERLEVSSMGAVSVPGRLPGPDAAVALLPGATHLLVSTGAPTRSTHRAVVLGGDGSMPVITAMTPAFGGEDGEPSRIDAVSSTAARAVVAASHRLFVVDWRDAERPRVAGMLALGSSAYVRQIVELGGERVAVVGQRLGGSQAQVGVLVVDVSDPSAPVEDAHYTSSAGLVTGELVSAGDLLALPTDRGLEVLRLDADAGLSLVGRLHDTAIGREACEQGVAHHRPREDPVAACADSRDRRGVVTHGLIAANGIAAVAPVGAVVAPRDDAADAARTITWSAAWYESTP